MVKKLIILLALWKALQIFFAILALKYIPTGETFFYAPKPLREVVPSLAWIWGNFDGSHYLEIARRGYQTHEQGFFPLYPLLIGIVDKLLNLPLIYIGLIISHLFFLVSLYYVYKLLILDKRESLIILVFALILFFPTSFYYASIYNDSLFFALATASLYYGRKQKWLHAGITGGLATLARLNGLTLLIFLAAEYYLQNKSTSVGKAIKNKLYWILIIPASFVAYLTYIQVRFGSFFTLFSSMKVWNQDKITFPLQVFWRYFKIIILYPEPQHLNYWVAVLEVGMVLFYIVMLYYSWRKIRLSYWIFFLLSIIIPSLTGTFAGMPRYGLHVYPLFLSLGLFLQQKNKYLRLAYFLISSILMAALLSLFVRAYFVA